MIRRATLADVAELVSMANKFVLESGARETFSPDRESISSGIECLVDETVHSGVVLVSEVHGTLLGFLAGCEDAPWFSWRDRYASELACWVTESYRGTRLQEKLRAAFEEWATGRGLRVVSVKRNGQTKLTRIPQQS